MKTEMMIVNFAEDVLQLVDHEGQPYVVMKPIVKALKLDWRGQQAKLLEKKEKFNYGLIPMVAEDGILREMGCIPLKKLNGWLFDITPAKIPNLDTRAKIEDYQEECFEALWLYWTEKAHPKSDIQKMVDGLNSMNQTMLGFDQMSLEDRKIMKATQWAIQGVLGLRPKSQMHNRIKMREPLNLLINGISSGQFRRSIGLQPRHRDQARRPMKTVDFLPRANQYALFKADMYLLTFLKECNFHVEYAEACALYLQYGQMAKVEAERLYHVSLYDTVRDMIQLAFDHVQRQLEADVSPYGQTEQQIEKLEARLKKELELLRKRSMIHPRPVSRAA